MPDKKLLLKKLEEILKQLNHLKGIVMLSESVLVADDVKFYFAQRVMERLIGAAIDINMHIARDQAGAIPDDYFESFMVLGKLKILPFSLAKKIAPSASLRNILVHEYQKLNVKKFTISLKEALKDYRKYARYIEKILK